MNRLWIAIAAVMLAGPGMLPAQQEQERRQREAQEQERQEMQRRLRELQAEVRELQRRLQALDRERRVAAAVPVSPAVVFPRQRARLGVTVNTRRNPAVDSIGAELSAVTPGGPADQAGLRTGDIIVTFNRERLAGRYPAASEYESEPGIKLMHFARELAPGDTVEVEYRRGNERRKATVVARELEQNEWFSFRMRPPDVRVDARPLVEGTRDLVRSMVFTFGDRWLDMELVSLNPELGEYFGTSEGLLVIRAPQEQELNLRSGDVILRIHGRAPSSQSHLLRILRSYAPGESVQIEVMRQRRRQTVTATIPERGRDHDWQWEHR